MKYKVGMLLKRTGRGLANTYEFSKYKGKICEVTEVTATDVYFTEGNFTGYCSSFGYADRVFTPVNVIYLGGE